MVPTVASKSERWGKEARRGLRRARLGVVSPLLEERAVEDADAGVKLEPLPGALVQPS